MLVVKLACGMCMSGRFAGYLAGGRDFRRGDQRLHSVRAFHQFIQAPFLTLSTRRARDANTPHARRGSLVIRMPGAGPQRPVVAEASPLLAAAGVASCHAPARIASHSEPGRLVVQGRGRPGSDLRLQTRTRRARAIRARRTWGRPAGTSAPSPGSAGPIDPRARARAGTAILSGRSGRHGYPRRSGWLVRGDPRLLSLHMRRHSELWVSGVLNHIQSRPGKP